MWWRRSAETPLLVTDQAQPSEVAGAVDRGLGGDVGVHELALVGDMVEADDVAELVHQHGAERRRPEPGGQLLVLGRVDDDEPGDIDLVAREPRPRRAS